MTFSKTSLFASTGAAALFLCAVPLASAQSTLENSDVVVVTGTKTNDFGAKSGIPIEKMPQSVQVVDSNDIIATGARTIEDALRVVPSATVAHSRIATFAGNTLRIRGFSPQQIRNGMYQRFYDGTDPSALSNVERIEVLKGPSGVLYGQSGIGGIVSIITKQPTDAFQGSVALTGGSYDQKMATVDIGGPVMDGLGIRFTGEIERSGSFTDFLDLERENSAVALAWRPTDWASAHFVAEYLHRKTLENPGLPVVGTVISNGVATVDRSTYFGEPSYNVQENHAPFLQGWVDFRIADGWTLTPRVQYSEWNNTSKSTTLLTPAPGSLTTIPRVGRNAGEKDKFWLAQLDLAGDFQALGISHKLLVGIEYNKDKVPFRMNDFVPCGIGSIDSLNPVYGCGPQTSNFGFLADARLEGVAIYAQDQIALTEAWNVVAGIRHSKSVNDNVFATAFFSSPSSADLDNTSWQLGTTYALGGGLSLFGGYNTGYDLGAVTASRRFDGVPFEPETSDQAEAGIRLTQDTLRGSISLFRIRRNNVAVADPANFGFQVQDGQFRVQGVEVEGEWSPMADWVLQGGYAYLDGEVSKTTEPALLGAQLAETPENAASFSARTKLGAIDLRASANYVGSRKMVNGGSVTLPEYTTVDLGAGMDFDTWRVDAVLSNVFDETYYFSDNASRFSLNTEDRVFPGDPRTFSIRLSHKFGGK
ncbi:MAG: TonB-dependent receptor [Hyphomonadaceae bacterium]